MTKSSRPCSIDGCLGYCAYSWVKYCGLHWEIRISENVKAFAEAEKIKVLENENTD